MPAFWDMVPVLSGLPEILAQLLVSIVIAYTACVFGVAFGKMGRNPVWGLAFIIPFLGTILIWIFGYGRWPQPERNTDLESGL